MDGSGAFHMAGAAIAAVGHITMDWEILFGQEQKNYHDPKTADSAAKTVARQPPSDAKPSNPRVSKVSRSIASS